tara:strand:- start:601 stop:1143 length:543 start_codon:yes stop_codon:yes gene_type:complete
MTRLTISIWAMLMFVLCSEIFSEEITHVTLGGVVYDIRGWDETHRNIFLKKAQEEAQKIKVLPEEKSDEQKRAEAQQRRKKELYSRRFNRTKIAQQKGNARRQAIASRGVNNFYIYSYPSPVYYTTRFYQPATRFYQPGYTYLNWYRNFGELYYGNEKADFYYYGYNAIHVIPDRDFINR